MTSKVVVCAGIYIKAVIELGSRNITILGLDKQHIVGPPAPGLQSRGQQPLAGPCRSAERTGAYHDGKLDPKWLPPATGNPPPATGNPLPSPETDREIYKYISYFLYLKTPRQSKCLHAPPIVNEEANLYETTTLREEKKQGKEMSEGRINPGHFTYNPDAQPPSHRGSHRAIEEDHLNSWEAWHVSPNNSNQVDWGLW